jgi:hypothetical protein
LEGRFRVRHDKVDAGGTVTLRHDSKPHHISLGRAHKGKPIMSRDISLRCRDASHEAADGIRTHDLLHGKQTL